jgi:hypothetical protein
MLSTHGHQWQQRLQVATLNRDKEDQLPECRIDSWNLPADHATPMANFSDDSAPAE